MDDRKANFLDVAASVSGRPWVDRLDVNGYTVLPVIGGKGHHGVWSREGLPSAAGTMVTISVIASEERLDEVLEPVFELVRRHIGIVTVSDVMVIRGDRF